tara:strand:+ start:298 stop:936 length:639 start_codon:yes stop_codon:yes gene_type:complete
MLGMNKYISEFLGSAFLFCAVVGSGIMAENITSDESIILFINSIITFFALYFLISGFNEYSNHFNPAVSLAMYFNNNISFKVLIIFTIIQIVGAVVGVLIANYMFEIPLFNFSTKNRIGINIYISEIIATFGLVFFILISKKSNTAIIVASYIAAAYWFTSSTSFANPAGTIGRMFSDTYAGISPENIFAFCIAQIIGSIIAVFLYKRFFKN